MKLNSLQHLLTRCLSTFKLSLPIMLCLAAVPAQAGTGALHYESRVLTVDGVARTVRIPRGYKLEFLSKLDGPRMLTFAANGDLFAGSRSGRVYRLPPPYTKAEVLARLGNYPHSVAFRPGEILIAQTDGVYHAPYRPGQASIAADRVRLLAALPGGSGHNSRTVSVGPDGRVYVSLGIQGNCSDQYLGKGYGFEDQRGGVLVLREDGGKTSWEPYASGLRNPVGLSWQPQTGVLYASNNGPDHLGYDLPPEYFSKLTAGSFHGMPWFQFDGAEMRQDGCVRSAPPRPVAEVSKPVATFPARNAPLGVAFAPKGALDTQLELDAAVALHGSWAVQENGGEASKRPPKLVMVRFDHGEAARVDDLITCFQLGNGARWARPAGVAFGPDGALYFSSDSELNGVFRLKRVGK